MLGVYATVGEFAAYLIAGCLRRAYFLIASAVAIGWQ